MKYSELYRNQSLANMLPQRSQSGKVAWRSPSNIALVKYWGKRSPQLPMNPSISFTLQNAYTETSIQYQYDPGIKETKLSYSFEGEENSVFSRRIRKYLITIQKYLPFLSSLKLTISSSNSFPHSAGIASSASAFSALALCLLDIEFKITGITIEEVEFYRKASFLARLGSGSASRSVYGGTVLWGDSPAIKNSTDEYAIDLSGQVHSAFRTYQDTILMLSEEEKKVSSSVGHKLMENNPYSLTRFSQAKKNISELYKVISEGDVDAFTDIVEAEAHILHAMMLTSKPGYLLMQPSTIEVISKIREFREQAKIPICFTLDAGPNVHLLFPQKYASKVDDFLQAELLRYCHEGRYISDCVGAGPIRL